jgi:HPt (histidine-containing phosphotransfer) domain-containing protein
MPGRRHNRGVQVIESAAGGATLDRERLRDITLDDADLMREIVAALIDDTSRQIELLDAAIRNQDGPQCARLAHYSKGACANVGANAAAALLRQIERTAARGEFQQSGVSLQALSREIDQLRAEAAL